MRPRRIKKRIVPTNCNFCHTDTVPDFRDLETLGKFVSERGKILAHTRTGICSRHQRILSRAIKQARFLALLPFVK